MPLVIKVMCCCCTASASSWTSTQKNIGGVGTKEGRSQEVLGPYKRNTDERALGAVPADYEDYINDRKPRRMSHTDASNSAGNSSLESKLTSVSQNIMHKLSYLEISQCGKYMRRRQAKGIVTIGCSSL